MFSELWQHSKTDTNTYAAEKKQKPNFARYQNLTFDFSAAYRDFIASMLRQAQQPQAQRPKEKHQLPNCLLSGQKTEGNALTVEIYIEDADIDLLVEFDFLTTHLRNVD